VTLRDDADGISMAIRDDGRGFDADTAVPAEGSNRGVGLVGMRERLRLLGGELELQTAPGGPTIVSAKLPRWVEVPPS